MRSEQLPASSGGQQQFYFVGPPGGASCTSQDPAQGASAPLMMLDVPSRGRVSTRDAISMPLDAGRRSAHANSGRLHNPFATGFTWATLLEVRARVCVCVCVHVCVRVCV